MTDPFSIAGFRREMERLFESAFGRAGFAPAVDLRDTESALVAECEIPGMKAEDVSVEVESGVLTIRGDRKREAGEGAVRSERAYGPFERRIDLPVEVDADRVAAEYDAGILRITLPKAASARPRKIRVMQKGAGP